MLKAKGEGKGSITLDDVKLNSSFHLINAKGENKDYVISSLKTK